MKEVTYEDWQKNPTPRMMWVWDNNPAKASKRKDENTKLKEENKFLKEQCLILTDGNVCNSICSEIKKQLTKAKEIIKDYMTIVKGAHTTVCGVPEENRTIYVLQLNEEAEEFLNSEVEQ